MPPFHIAAEVLRDALQLVPGSLQPSPVEHRLEAGPGTSRVAEKVGKRVSPERLGELFDEVQLILRTLQRFRTFEGQADVPLQGLESRRKSWLEHWSQLVQELAQALYLLPQGSRWDRC